MTHTEPLYWILAATLVGGVISVLIAAALTRAVAAAWVPRMVSFAVGAMLGAAFLHLLPEAFSQADSIEGLCATALAGLLFFFTLEKAVHWHHRHDVPDEHAAAAPRAALLIVLGDGLHNFTDGVLIAAAFLADTQLGIAATAAIIAHEAPQEVGDFMALLAAGISRRRALMLNAASALAAVAGDVVGYLALAQARAALPYVLVLAASSFIYIAVADLIPKLHRHNDTRSISWQAVLVTVGLAVVAVPHALLHSH